MATSPARLTANRANARRSTGPRTLTGKGTSSRNATKHGLRSRQPLLPDEDQVEYELLSQRLVDALTPASVMEEIIVDDIVEADAHGWSEAFGSTPQLIPVEMVATAKGTDGRGERTRAYTPSPSLIIPVTNVPSYVHRDWKTA